MTFTNSGNGDHRSGHQARAPRAPPSGLLGDQGQLSREDARRDPVHLVLPSPVRRDGSAGPVPRSRTIRRIWTTRSRTPTTSRRCSWSRLPAKAASSRCRPRSRSACARCAPAHDIPDRRRRDPDRHGTDRHVPRLRGARARSRLHLPRKVARRRAWPRSARCWCRRSRFVDEFSLAAHLHVRRGRLQLRRRAEGAARCWSDDELMRRCAATATQLMHDARRRARAATPTSSRRSAARGMMVGIQLRDQSDANSHILRMLSQQGHLGHIAAGYMLNVHDIRLAPTLTQPFTLRLEPSAYVPAERAAARVRRASRRCAAPSPADRFAHLTGVPIPAGRPTSPTTARRPRAWRAEPRQADASSGLSRSSARAGGHRSCRALAARARSGQARGLSRRQQPADRACVFDRSTCTRRRAPPSI